MTYYKVVLRKNKKLYSSFAHMFHYKPVRYMVGKWTKSVDKSHPLLFVTSDIDTALSILRTDIEFWQHKYGAIYECEVLGINEFLSYPPEHRVGKIKLTKRLNFKKGVLVEKRKK
jgi:hypothetical protein